jgi:phospholipid/cholesterol/gamma-HCH transport system permease protein
MTFAFDPNQNRGGTDRCRWKVNLAGEGMVRVCLEGNWKLDQALPQPKDILTPDVIAAGIRKITFESQALTGWDSGLLVFLRDLARIASERRINVDSEGLPEGVRKLLALASAVPERKGARRSVEHEPILARIGAAAVSLGQGTAETFTFIGECSVALVKLVTGKARLQRSDLLVFVEDCGVSALPIVTLLSMLFGLILAFIGAVQLMMFGAQIYVADLVGIAVVRVMGAVMCGVIMAGRTGAAFAAQLGTMQVNQEIDALKTLGISPIEFLVLPRMVALCLMMPLLCLYADMMGIVGGLVVAVWMLDINVVQYLNQTLHALKMSHFLVGLTHAFVFGVLVALFGCLKGMRCGRSAAAVGEATTSAVVACIVAIVVSTAAIMFICNVLKV